MTTILFNKPYGVLSQFTSDGGHRNLAEFIDLPGVYAAGRLDRDSEGLLVLTDDGRLQAKLSQPKFKVAKTYWAQVEGVPDAATLAALRKGVKLKDGMTKPAGVRLMKAPHVGPRVPPIRVRQSVPDSWIELILREGRNRQVRRMTAAVGHPTLRLIRSGIGVWTFEGLQPGEWRRVAEP